MAGRIVKVIRWIPKIWKTHDHDYYYALLLLKYQLEDMIAYSKANKVYINQEKDCADMELCVKIIEILEYEDLNNHYFEYLMHLLKRKLRHFWI